MTLIDRIEEYAPLLMGVQLALLMGVVLWMIL